MFSFQQSLMIYFLLIAFTIVIQSQNNNQLSIRAGIVQLQMGSLSMAGYKINYNQQLPDNVYNSMVAISYANSLQLSKGIVLISECPDTTQTSLGCTITANSLNKNNIVYVSYVASDVGSLIIGSYKQVFSFSNTTSISGQLKAKPLVNNEYINNSNVLFVNFYPFISGVDTIDPDFSVTIDSKSFDALTFEINIGYTIRQMHAKNVTIIFGYMLYDSSKITVSLYRGQRLTPDNVASGYIYGIGAVLAQAQSANRRLQVVPKPSTNLLATPEKIPFITPKNPVNVQPAVVKRKNNSSITPSTPSTPPSAARPDTKKTPPTNLAPNRPSTIATALRNSTEQVLLTPQKVDSSQFNQLMQPDGVIDANQTAVKLLQRLGVIHIQAPGVKDKLPGIDNQLFNSLFSMNGFVILTAADDVDQIYYYQVNSVQNSDEAKFPLNAPVAPPMPSAIVDPAMPTSLNTDSSNTKIMPASTTSTVSTILAAFNKTTVKPLVLYASTVSNARQNITCKGGVLVGRLQFVDYVQQKMVKTCVRCPKGTYLDLQRKQCAAFPIISFYLNQIDPAK